MKARNCRSEPLKNLCFRLIDPCRKDVDSCLPQSIGERPITVLGGWQLGPKRGFLDVKRVMMGCQQDVDSCLPVSIRGRFHSVRALILGGLRQLINLGHLGSNWMTIRLPRSSSFWQILHGNTACAAKSGLSDELFSVAWYQKGRMRLPLTLKGSCFVRFAIALTQKLMEQVFGRDIATGPLMVPLSVQDFFNTIVCPSLTLPARKEQKNERVYLIVQLVIIKPENHLVAHHARQLLGGLFVHRLRFRLVKNKNRRVFN